MGRNPAYSLRAFARDLSLLPNHLSEILSGKKGLSPHKAGSMGRSLGLSPRESDEFVTLVMAESARSRAVRTRARQQIDQGRALGVLRTLDLNTDQWKIVANPEHLALLEYLRIHPKTTALSAAAIAHGETPARVEETARRLELVGLLKRRRNSGWRVPKEMVRSPDGVASSAIREFHHQILRQAKEALDAVPVDERDFSALVLALSPKNLREARSRIRAFLSLLHEELSEASATPGTRIYSIGVQAFPMTQGDPL